MNHPDTFIWISRATAGCDGALSVDILALDQHGLCSRMRLEISLAEQPHANSRPELEARPVRQVGTGQSRTCY